ncbi:MAG: Flp pilus assembly complex ATPase component TadA [Phycisphaera sp.]|nr:MAG: Flp pilus assembly complex ATPase component TadA [Phycisphaera sp.]
MSKLSIFGKGKQDGVTEARASGDALPGVARALRVPRLTADALLAFREMPGSDTEPWDMLISAMATDEQSSLKLLAERTGLPFVAEPRLSESALRFYEMVPPNVARERHVGGVASDGRCMTIATAQPMQPDFFTQLEEHLGMPLRLVLTPRAVVQSLVNRGYEQRQDLVTEIIEEMPLDERAIASAAGSVGAGNDLLALARQGPVIRLVNMILFEALRRRASDVHVHPEETRLNIRLRVDGMLVDAFSPPLSLASAISSRLKVMTELDIANRHSPQDGQTTVRVGAHKVDIRLSVIPTVHGERLVMRLLDQGQNKLSLDTLGMTQEMQAELKSTVDRPNGMLLVTGPTGSGKTTTLYSALGMVDRDSRNVMTIEDPVEYRLEGISQMQVNAKRGVTFAAGLRSLLRQDPDVILVGEVRDHETAQLAVQASLTGHLVLATLHTNDAPSAIPRLLDIGVEPFLVTSSLLGVMAQRLVRRLATPEEQNESGQRYRGRMGVYELMRMNDELRTLTAQRSDGVLLMEAAKRAGFKPMIEDAKMKAAKGMTDEAEIKRVLS